MKTENVMNVRILKDYSKYFTADDLELLFEICNKSRQQGAKAERERLLKLHDKNMDKFIEELREFRKEKGEEK